MDATFSFANQLQRRKHSLHPAERWNWLGFRIGSRHSDRPDSMVQVVEDMEEGRCLRAEIQKVEFRMEPINDVRNPYPPKTLNCSTQVSRSTGYPRRHRRRHQ